MLPRIEELLLAGFELSLSVAVGAMAWWRRDTPEDDACVIQATDTVIDALSDADVVGKIDAVTSRNLRDQVTLQEVIDMHEEKRLRGMGWKRN